jgi:hypothetical protein
VVQQRFTRCRQRHAFGLTHKQTDAEHLLQLHQPLARRLHRNRLPRRGTSQRALLVHGNKQLESDQVETADQAFCSMWGLMAGDG